MLPRGSQKLNPEERVEANKHGLLHSYHDQKILRIPKDISPKSFENHLKQRSNKKGTEESELVKYMSKVPAYLGRDKKPQEKILNAGVLDWGRLEKWQHKNKQKTQKDKNNRQRHAALQFHLSSPMEGHSEVEESVSMPQDHSISRKISYDEKGGSNEADEHFLYKPSTIMLEQNAERVSDHGMAWRRGKLPSKLSCKDVPHIKIKPKPQDGESVKTEEKSDVRNMNKGGQVSQKTAIFLRPLDASQNNRYGKSGVADSKVSLAQGDTEINRKSFSGRTNNSCRARGHSGLSKPWAFTRDVDAQRERHRKHNDTKDAIQNRSSPERTEPTHLLTRTSVNPPGGGNLEEKALLSTKSNVYDNLKDSDLKSSEGLSENRRSVSPFCRLSFSMSKTSKGLMDVSCTSGLENAAAASSIGSSYSTDRISKDKNRSSTVRRLLEPLMKSKAANSCNTFEPLQSNSTRHQTAGYGASSENKTHGSAMIQAFFRVVVKSNQLLFTFAVDKEKDIVAATLNKLSNGENKECSYIYTFFSIRELKKKNGKWINRGVRGHGPDYITNVVGQMHVSCSRAVNSCGDNQVNHCSTREFVLFAVGLQQADHQTSDLQTSDELAAIIIKIPESVNRTVTENMHNSSQDNSSEAWVKEHLAERYRSGSGENCSLRHNQDTNVTVILPSSLHSLPHKGGPSSLIQRWRSGGSCDCGGWDMGCNLRVLTNQNQLSTNSLPSKASLAQDQLQHLFLGGQQENCPSFSFSPLKDGIYSVDYHSSLSLLQAFSTCIAIAESRAPVELSEPENSCGHSKEHIIDQCKEEKHHTIVEGDPPARYVSYPLFRPLEGLSSFNFMLKLSA